MKRKLPPTKKGWPTKKKAKKVLLDREGKIMLQHPPKRPTGPKKICDQTNATYVVSDGGIPEGGYMYCERNFGTSNVVQCLNFPVEGTDFFNRVGNKILMESIQLQCRFRYSFNDGVTQNTDYIRVALVYDRQTNAAAPAYGDIYEGQQTGNSLTHQFLGPFARINWANRERFKILREWDFTISSPPSYTDITAMQQYSDAYNINEFVKLNLETVFNKAGNQTGGGSYQDIQTGALWLVTQGQYLAGSNAWNLEYGSRIVFRDL